MTSEERERLLFNAGMVLLAASNIIADAKTALEGDEELDAIHGALLYAHFFVQEKTRSLTEPIGRLTVEQAEKLARKREQLSETLITAGELFTVTAKVRLEATMQYIETEQKVAPVPLDRKLLITQI